MIYKTSIIVLICFLVITPIVITKESQTIGQVKVITPTGVSFPYIKIGIENVGGTVINNIYVTAEAFPTIQIFSIGAKTVNINIPTLQIGEIYDNIKISIVGLGLYNVSAVASYEGKTTAGGNNYILFGVIWIKY